MYKAYKFFTLLCCITPLLIACGDEKTSDNTGVIQVDIEAIETIVNGEKDGFLLAIYDENEEYLEKLNQIATEENIKINLYHVFYPDGKDTEKSNEPVFDMEKKLKKNHLYYFQNGQVKGEFRMTSYDTFSDLKENLVEFISTYKEG